MKKGKRMNTKIIMERPELIRVSRAIRNGVNAEFVYEIAEKQDSSAARATRD